MRLKNKFESIRLLSLDCKSQIEVCNVLFEDGRNRRGTCDLCMHISRDCLGSLKKPGRQLRASSSVEKKNGLDAVYCSVH